jgi:hypothetical protein
MFLGTGPVTGERYLQDSRPRPLLGWCGRDAVQSGTYEAAHGYWQDLAIFQHRNTSNSERSSMVLPGKNPTKSYWIEAAESPLRDFRSSDELPEETDVVIIGSGYSGAATAYWIHKVRDHRTMPHQLSL